MADLKWNKIQDSWWAESGLRKEGSINPELNWVIGVDDEGFFWLDDSDNELLDAYRAADPDCKHVACSIFPTLQATKAECQRRENAIREVQHA